LAKIHLRNTDCRGSSANGADVRTDARLTTRTQKFAVLAGWSAETTPSGVDANLARTAKGGASVRLVVDDAIAVVIDTVTLLLSSGTATDAGKSAIPACPFSGSALTASLAAGITKLVCAARGRIEAAVNAVWRSTAFVDLTITVIVDSVADLG